jgi:hypothetical protein
MLSNGKVNAELERIPKWTALALSNYYTSFGMEGMKKRNMKEFKQNS